MITLCDKCHEEIEEGKRQRDEEKHQQILEAQLYWESQREKREQEKQERLARRKHHMDLIRQFINEHKDDDLSNVGIGMKNYCDLTTARNAFYPWMRAHGAEEFDDGYIQGLQTVQDYFRNRKYEVILRMMLDGKSERDVEQQTGFTSHMIHKVFTNPTQARTFLYEEREERNHV